MAAEAAAEASLAPLSPEQRQPGREDDAEEKPEGGDDETAALSEGRARGGRGRAVWRHRAVWRAPAPPFSSEGSAEQIRRAGRWEQAP